MVIQSVLLNPYGNFRRVCNVMDTRGSQLHRYLLGMPVLIIARKHVGKCGFEINQM